MIFEKLTKTWDGIHLENKMVRYAVLILALSNLVLVFKYSDQAPSVVLVPPNLNAKTEIAQNKADSEYKKVWGLFVAQLLGNVTPGQAGFLVEAIDPLLHPSIYDSVRTSMAIQVDALKLERVTLTFAPNRVSYEPETDTVFVTGTLTSQGVSGPPDKKTRTYEMKFEVTKFRPALTFIDVYPGSPRTKDVKENLEKLKKSEGRNA